MGELTRVRFVDHLRAGVLHHCDRYQVAGRVLLATDFHCGVSCRAADDQDARTILGAVQRVDVHGRRLVVAAQARGDETFAQERRTCHQFRICFKVVLCQQLLQVRGLARVEVRCLLVKQNRERGAGLRACADSADKAVIQVRSHQLIARDEFLQVSLHPVAEDEELCPRHLHDLGLVTLREFSLCQQLGQERETPLGKQPCQLVRPAAGPHHESQYRWHGRS